MKSNDRPIGKDLNPDLESLIVRITTENESKIETEDIDLTFSSSEYNSNPEINSFHPSKRAVSEF